MSYPRSARIRIATRIHLPRMSNSPFCEVAGGAVHAFCERSFTAGVILLTPAG
jgi:hypothetical protein